jgi:hypothetical protein
MNKFRFERSTDKREKILQIFVGLKEKANPEIIQSEMPPQKRAIHNTTLLLDHSRQWRTHRNMARQWVN